MGLSCFTGKHQETTNLQFLCSAVKGINFYGPKSEYVVSGSDCGHIFLWDKETTEVVQFLCGDDAGVVNCLEPHPNCPVLATSGLDHDVKIWSPTSNQPTNLDGLDMTMSNNERERAEEKCMPRDPVSERLFRMLMRHARRHRMQGLDDDEDEDDSSDSSSEESSDDDSDDDESRHAITCSQA
ncbi:DDB1- and CUL4-associated factor 8-like [Corticium candelabrum]|uniref:DDB1- and CUL4-associated factor 8-like n=1 Tax=Corticium candelabrum TaxID=121492 RepID=UPI002E2725AA|nr:DDB1- and CUL4-associated factor 8-like [Corticium candelabrum]